MMVLSISTCIATTAPPGTLVFNTWMNSCHNKQHGTLYYVLFLQLGREALQMLQLEKSQYHAAAFFEQDSCSILVCIYACILQACSHSTVIQFKMDTSNIQVYLFPIFYIAGSDKYCGCATLNFAYTRLADQTLRHCIIFQAYTFPRVDHLTIHSIILPASSGQAETVYN